MSQPLNFAPRSIQMHVSLQFGSAVSSVARYVPTPLIFTGSCGALSLFCLRPMRSTAVVMVAAADWSLEMHDLTEHRAEIYVGMKLVRIQ